MKRLFFFVCAGLLVGCEGRIVSTPKAARTPLSFTSEQASNALANVAALIENCTPRDGGTPESEHAAAWLNDRLKAHGIRSVVDRFTDVTPVGPRTFANVLATIPGDDDQWIVLLSHFDTKSGIGKEFQGANDGGSSTGLLLELAALIQKAGPRKHSVLCAFLDGEECRLAYSDRDGFHGSKRLAKTMKEQQKKIAAVILMDMIGDRDLKITIPSNSTPKLRVLALVVAEALKERTKIGLCDGEIYDDHYPFLKLGYPAVDLIDFYYGSRPGLNEYWHTPQDTLDKLSADSLLSTGRIVLEMVNRL